MQATLEGGEEWPRALAINGGMSRSNCLHVGRDDRWHLPCDMRTRDFFGNPPNAPKQIPRRR